MAYHDDEFTWSDSIRDYTATAIFWYDIERDDDAEGGRTCFAMLSGVQIGALTLMGDDILSLLGGGFAGRRRKREAELAAEQHLLSLKAQGDEMPADPEASQLKYSF